MEIGIAHPPGLAVLGKIDLRRRVADIAPARGHVGEVGVAVGRGGHRGVGGDDVRLPLFVVDMAEVGQRQCRLEHAAIVELQLAEHAVPLADIVIVEPAPAIGGDERGRHVVGRRGPARTRGRIEVEIIVGGRVERGGIAAEIAARHDHAEFAIGAEGRRCDQLRLARRPAIAAGAPEIPFADVEPSADETASLAVEGAARAQVGGAADRIAVHRGGDRLVDLDPRRERRRDDVHRHVAPPDLVGGQRHAIDLDQVVIGVEAADRQELRLTARVVLDRGDAGNAGQRLAQAEVRQGADLVRTDAVGNNGNLPLRFDLAHRLQPCTGDHDLLVRLSGRGRRLLSLSSKRQGRGEQQQAAADRERLHDSPPVRTASTCRPL